MIKENFNNILLIVQPLITGAYANITDPQTLFKLINNNSSINGTLGIGLITSLFIILTIIFSYQVEIINGLLVASFICMIIGVFMNQIGVLANGYILLFLAMTLAFAVISMAKGLLRPFT